MLPKNNGNINIGRQSVRFYLKSKNPNFLRSGFLDLILYGTSGTLALAGKEFVSKFHYWSFVVCIYFVDIILSSQIFQHNFIYHVSLLYLNNVLCVFA